jgi:hypothetical protein
MLTPDELRQIKAALVDYLFLLDGEATDHQHCDEECGAKGQIDLDLAETQAALDLLDRELNQE